MEIPLELMITIRQKHPWMFFPDFVPIGHPIFDIINSTDPEVIAIRKTDLGFCYVKVKVIIFPKFLSLFQFLNVLMQYAFDITDRLGS